MIKLKVSHRWAAW